MGRCTSSRKNERASVGTPLNATSNYTVLVASSLFSWAIGAGMGRLAAAVSERQRDRKTVPLDEGGAEGSARQRIAVRYDTNGVALELVEIEAGTANAKVTLRGPDGSATYFLEITQHGPNAQSMRCSRRR
jgi:hypothetical protein